MEGGLSWGANNVRLTWTLYATHFNQIAVCVRRLCHRNKHSVFLVSLRAMLTRVWKHEKRKQLNSAGKELTYQGESQQSQENRNLLLQDTLLKFGGLVINQIAFETIMDFNYRLNRQGTSPCSSFLNESLSGECLTSKFWHLLTSKTKISLSFSQWKQVMYLPVFDKRSHLKWVGLVHVYSPTCSVNGFKSKWCRWHSILGKAWRSKLLARLHLDEVMASTEFKQTATEELFFTPSHRAKYCQKSLVILTQVIPLCIQYMKEILYI